jgi:hypothetical protein
MVTVGFFIGYAIGTYFHELGHFVMAKICGFPVDSVTLGRGPTILSYLVGRTKFIFNLLPSGGLVLSYPGIFAPRYKLVLFYVGGLVANAVLIVVFAVFEKFNIAGIPEKLLVGAIIAQYVFIGMNLLPHRTPIYGADHDTDGLKLWKLFGREWSKNIVLVRNFYSELLQSYATQSHPAPRFSEVPPERQRFLVLQNAVASEQVRELAAIVDDDTIWKTFSRPEQLLILDRILGTILLSDMITDFPDWREKLLKWCLQISELGPDVNAIKDTRAGVLDEIGDFPGALEVIDSTDLTKLNDFALILCLVSFARARFSQGEFGCALAKSAEARLKAAKLLNPDPIKHLFDRMDKEFAGSKS